MTRHEAAASRRSITTDMGIEGCKRAVAKRMAACSICANGRCQGAPWRRRSRAAPPRSCRQREDSLSGLDDFDADAVAVVDPGIARLRMSDGDHAVADLDLRRPSRALVLPLHLGRLWLDVLAAVRHRSLLSGARDGAAPPRGRPLVVGYSAVRWTLRRSTFRSSTTKVRAVFVTPSFS